MDEEKIRKIKEIFQEYSAKLRNILVRKKDLLSEYRTELENARIDQIKKQLKDM